MSIEKELEKIMHVFFFNKDELEGKKCKGTRSSKCVGKKNILGYPDK